MVITNYQIGTVLFFIVFIGWMINYSTKIKSKKDE
jgi:cbb3-type cytochrome oxidase subunit 3